MEEILFRDDPVYQEQEAKAIKVEEQNKAMNFLGYKMLDSCANCKFSKGGDCHLLEESYAGPVFKVFVLGKCKHYKKDSSK